MALNQKVVDKFLCFFFLKVCAEREGARQGTKQKVGGLWFWGVEAREFPGGLLRLDPAFAYVEPPSS